MLKNLKQDLQKLANPKKAKILQQFFKTGKGEYGQGDIFLGITVPQQRKLVKKYSDLKLTGIQKLLRSKIHEHRLTALLILIEKYKKNKNKIFNFYLKNTRYINNWDLVDLTAPKIVGNYLLNKDRKILYKLARSDNLWQKRIAIIATYEFIKNNQFKDTIKISQILSNDSRDLIHKAAGWMLREMGKRDEQKLIKFLEHHAHHMPRTMLRYSIEKFPEKKRKYFLNQKIPH